MGKAKAMKTERIFKIGFGLLTLVFSQLFYSCDDQGVIVKVPNDYFPLMEGTQVAYMKEYSSISDEEIWGSDTLTLSIQGDTLIEGIAYKKMLNGYGLLEKVVRRQGSQYFGRNHELYGGFSKEYLFLDTSVPVNGSWEHVKNEGQYKTEYVVTEVNATHIVHGVEYKNVIKVDVNYYERPTEDSNFELLYSAKHYYAKGVGEIYAYYPYPASNMFSNLKISILPDTK
jgi:hypothetical protein